MSQDGNSSLAVQQTADTVPVSNVPADSVPPIVSNNETKEGTTAKGKQDVAGGASKRKRTAPVKRAPKGTPPKTEEQKQPVATEGGDSSLPVASQQPPAEEEQHVELIDTTRPEGSVIIPKTKAIYKPPSPQKQQQRQTEYVGIVYPKRTELYNTGRSAPIAQNNTNQGDFKPKQTFSRWDRRFKRL